MAELKRFKFVTTLVLVFKNLEVDDKTKYDTFYSNSKAEKYLSMKVTLVMYLNQYILQLYQTKIFWKRLWLDY